MGDGCCSAIVLAYASIVEAAFIRFSERRDETIGATMEMTAPVNASMLLIALLVFLRSYTRTLPVANYQKYMSNTHEGIKYQK
jgi:hypothetical protein